jgi:hypothetical protein
MEAHRNTTRKNSFKRLTEDGRLRARHAPAERELVDPEAADA